jgi:hypothetical protein
MLMVRVGLIPLNPRPPESVILTGLCAVCCLLCVRLVKATKMSLLCWTTSTLTRQTHWQCSLRCELDNAVGGGEGELFAVLKTRKGARGGLVLTQQTDWQCWIGCEVDVGAARLVLC